MIENMAFGGLMGAETGSILFTLSKTKIKSCQNFDLRHF